MNLLLRDELASIIAASPLPPDTSADLQFPAVDVSPRAIKTRAILYIADMHKWHLAITHFLEIRGKPYLSDLTDPQLEDLLQRMEGYVDAAETGSSLADCLPAS
ncbi:MAG: hypothetical protein WKG03_21665 [Telluria sp.]